MVAFQIALSGLPRRGITITTHLDPDSTHSKSAGLSVTTIVCSVLSSVLRFVQLEKNSYHQYSTTSKITHFAFAC